MAPSGDKVKDDINENSLINVLRTLEKKTPLYLAETWDNVGLLVEPPDVGIIYSILFTNDLTEAVMQEAILKSVNMIYSYHPPIFTPHKALVKGKWKDWLIMKCIQNNIAVYSPHTASDAVIGGVNDWLISCFELENIHSIKPNGCSSDRIYKIKCKVNEEILHHLLKIPTVEINRESLCDQNNANIKVNFQYLSEVLLHLNSRNIDIETCELLSSLDYGAGRIGNLKTALTIKDVISTIKKHLHLSHLRISFGKNHLLDTLVQSIAVCAGSGATVLRGAIADLHVTGEMSHHELLDMKHQNITVILCEHSNSERGYLKQLTRTLEDELRDIKLIISEKDKDPIDII